MSPLRPIFILCIALLTLNSYAQQPAVPQLQSDPGSDYFARVRQIYESAQTAATPEEKRALFTRATPLLRDYIQRYPRHQFTEPAYYYLAESYHALGQLNDANQIFQLLVSRYKNGTYVAAAAYRLAYGHYAEKRYAHAAQLFSITAANAKEEVDKLRSTYFQAQCYLLLKQNEKAQPLLDKVANSTVDTPYRAQAVMTNGQLLLTSKEYAKALEQYKLLITPDQAPSTLAEACIHAAAACVSLKNYEEAKSFFLRALATKDAVWAPKAHIGLLSLYYKEKNFDAILSQVQGNTLKLEPEMLSKQGVIVGSAYYQKKLYTQAIKYFIDVEKSSPQTPQALEAGYLKLRCFYNIDGEQIPRQVDEFITNNAVGNGTHKYIHQALIMKAEALFDQKKYKEAAKTYASIDTKFVDKKNLASLLYKKGWCYSQISNHTNAVESFTRFLEVDPEDPRAIDVTVKRGLSYTALGERINALRDFDAVIKAKPKSKSAALALQQSARLQRIAKQYSDMIERYETLLANFPDLENNVRANAHYWNGWGYFKESKFGEAATHLQQAAKLGSDPYAKQAAMLLVLCYYSLNDVDALKSSIAQAEKLDVGKKVPSYVYRWIGQQCYNEADYKAAVQYLKQGLEKGGPRTTAPDVWRILAKSQLENGDLEDALTSVDNLLGMVKDDVEKVDGMLDKAKILIGLNKYAEAKSIASAALEMRPGGAVKAGLLMVMADCAYHTKDYATAAEHYVLIVESFSDLPFYKTALTRLIDSLEKSGKSSETSTYKDLLKKQEP